MPPGDLEHLLLHCPGLQTVRTNLERMWLEKTAVLPPLQAYIVQLLVSSAAEKMAFILDCAAVPEIIKLGQIYGMDVLGIAFYITRTYVYGIHRKKLILTGKWPYAVKNPDCASVAMNPQTNISVAGPMKHAQQYQNMSTTSTLSLHPVVVLVPPQYTASTTQVTALAQIPKHTSTSPGEAHGDQQDPPNYLK